MSITFTEVSTQQLLTIWYRHEGDFEQSFSSLWKGCRCGRPPQFKNARSSICFVSRCRDGQEGNARSKGVPALREIYGRLSRSSPTYTFNLHCQQISFAKTRSEAVVKALDPTNYETYHQERLKHKSRARWDNPHRRKAKAKKEAIAAGAEGVTAGPKKPVVQMPDEYLPPNKILFIQNLPIETTKDQLNSLFSQYVLCSQSDLRCAPKRFTFQVREPVGYSCYSRQEGYCLRRIYGREERYRREGSTAQLQDRRGEQNQGLYFELSWARAYPRF